MAKTRRTRAEAAQEQHRLLGIASSGGSIHLAVEDEGAFVILEGMPHVEIPGATIAEALRAFASMLEQAEADAAVPDEVAS